MLCKRKVRFWKAIRVSVLVPVLLVGGCLTSDDLRSLIGDGVGLAFNAAETAVNNWIDQSLIES